MKVYVIEQTIFNPGYNGWSHLTAIYAIKSTEQKAIDLVDKMKSKEPQVCWSYREYEVD